MAVTANCHLSKLKEKTGTYDLYITSASACSGRGQLKNICANLRVFARFRYFYCMTLS